MSCRMLLSGTGLWLAAVAAAAPPADSSAPATDRVRSLDDYRVLVQRNIFLRDRRPARLESAPRPVARVVRDTDSGIVLTGIGRYDGEFVAFFENVASGRTSRVGVGEAVGKGRIKSITLDLVEYERERSVTEIRVGYALGGERYLVETPPATSPSDLTSPATGPTTAASRPAAEAGPPVSPGAAESSDLEDILRQMRQRREQELRK